MTEWNFESMLELLQQRFEAQEKAIAKAELAVEKRLESMNEFRGQLKDQSAQFVTRAEFTTALKHVEQKVDDLKQYRDTSSGKSLGINALWLIVLGIISALGTAVAILYTLNK